MIVIVLLTILWTIFCQISGKNNCDFSNGCFQRQKCIHYFVVWEELKREMIFGSQQQEQQIKDHLGECFSEKFFSSESEDGIVLEQWSEKLEEFFQLHDNNSTVPNNTKINIKEIPYITDPTYSNNITIIKIEEDLRIELLQSYNKNIGPWTISNSSCDVSANIMFDQIIDADQSRGSLSMLVWFRLSWNDPRFIWKPQKCKGIESVYLNQGEFWDPDIEIWNSMESIEKSFQPQGANVDYNGNLIWSRMGQIKISCDVKGLFEFPDYTSTCPLEVGSWTYNSSKVMMGIFENGSQGATSENAASTQYNIVDVENPNLEDNESYTQNDSEWSQILYKVEIHQNLAKDMLGVIVSKTLLTFISFGAFWLPPSSGERIAFTVTVPMIVELVKFQQVASSTQFSFGCFLFSLFVVFESIFTAILWQCTDPYCLQLSPQMAYKKWRSDKKENTYWADVFKAVDTEITLQNVPQISYPLSFWLVYIGAVLFLIGAVGLIKKLIFLVAMVPGVILIGIYILQSCGLMGFIRKPFSQNYQNYNNLELTKQKLRKLKRTSCSQDSTIQNTSYLNSVCSQTGHDVPEIVKVTQHLQPLQQEILKEVQDGSTMERLITFPLQNIQQAQAFQTKFWIINNMTTLEKAINDCVGSIQNRT